MSDPTDRLAALVEAARAAGPDADFAALAAEHGVDPEEAADALAALRALESGERAYTLPRPELPERFELLDELGRGGMGVVYRARQKGLERDVAVKVLVPGELVFGEALTRFQREARVLARLRHPHIVPIHEVGEASGSVYYAMDLFEGGSLADLLAKKRRPMPVARVVKLMRQVAGAVAFVHGHGLVHRDLKPANVLLDEAGDAYVADFGLAVDPSEGATLTATGRLLGTPDYMAPEQARGERARITERTDVYALGVMLYECLTGRRPFAGRGLVDKIHAVVHEEPPAPRKVNADVPAELERVVLQAMAKEPDERYATASALAEDLARFEEGRPVEAKGVSGWVRARRFAQRHRSAVAAAALGATLAGLLLDSSISIERSSHERLADAQRLMAAGERSAADLLYLDALDDLRGRASLDEAERALAVDGLAAAIARFDRSDSPQQSALLAQIEADAAWLVGLLGDSDVRSWLVRVTVADRGGDAHEVTQQYWSWIWQIANQPSGTMQLDGILESYVRDVSHPFFAAACVKDVWSLRYPEVFGWAPLDRPWLEALLAVASLGGVSFEAGPGERGAPAWAERLFGDRRLSVAEEELLFSDLLDPSRHDSERMALVTLAEWLLDAPAPVVRRVTETGHRRYKTIGAEIPDGAMSEYVSILRGLRGTNYRERIVTLAEYACRFIERHHELDTLVGFDRHTDWLQVRTGVRLWNIDEPSRALEFWRHETAGDVEAYLVAKLPVADVSPAEWIRRLEESNKSVKPRSIHERLLYLSDAPERAPRWLGASMIDVTPPLDLVGRWREHFGLDVIVPSRLDVALLRVAGHSDPLVLIDSSQVLLERARTTGHSISTSLDGALKSYEPTGLYDLELRDHPLRQLRPPNGTYLEPGAVELDIRVDSTEDVEGSVVRFEIDARARLHGARAATPLPIRALHPVVPEGATRVVAEFVPNATPRRGAGAVSNRLFLLVRVSADAAPLVSSVDWLHALEAEHEEWARYDATPEPYLPQVLKKYWDSSNPALLGRWARAPGSEALVERLTSRIDSTGYELGRGASSRVCMAVRAFELALGRTTPSPALAQSMERLSTSFDDSSRFGFGGNAGALEAHLLVDELPEVRRAAAMNAYAGGLTAAELEAVRIAWRDAGDVLPDRIAQHFENRWVYWAQDIRRGNAVVWVLFLLLAASFWLLRVKPVVAATIAGAAAVFMCAVPPMAKWVPELDAVMVWTVAIAATCAAGRERQFPWASICLFAATALPILAVGSAHADAWNAAARVAFVAAAASLAVRPPEGTSRLAWTVAAALTAAAFLPSAIVLAARSMGHEATALAMVQGVSAWPLKQGFAAALCCAAAAMLRALPRPD